MSLLIGFLTFILILNCLFLILLVLIQLPKKEAGAGIAFGGGATDALFGAGSGNALTKLTKYAATAFLGMALLLFVLNLRKSRESSDAVSRALAAKAAATGSVTAPAAAPASQTVPLQSATSTNALRTTIPTPSTNLEAVINTSAPAPTLTVPNPAATAPGTVTPTTTTPAPTTAAPKTQQPVPPANQPAK